MPAFNKLAVATLVLALIASPLSAKRAAPARDNEAIASAPLFTAKGADAGYAVITVRRDQAILRLSLNGLTPGEHGLHFHTTGACKGENFSGAGGHLNPAGHQHGMKNPAGSHLGDLPNVTADANGIVLTQIALTGSAKALAAALFDADGSAIVVHAGADDYMTDPAGNSGARVACGVFRANR